ncbi:MAG: hypothetical protein K1X28_07280 [Parachlamydiales bacterium]|nr:hypothetical protein [Parachlamydiales bacterium]
MRRIFGIAFCLLNAASGFAEYAIIGGDASKAYSALVSISAQATELSPLPTDPT